MSRERAEKDVAGKIKKLGSVRELELAYECGCGEHQYYATGIIRKGLAKLGILGVTNDQITRYVYERSLPKWVKARRKV